MCRSLSIYRQLLSLFALALVTLPAAQTSLALPGDFTLQKTYNASGLNGPALAVLSDGAGNWYVGGSFTAADGILVNHIARWDGNQWHALGAGFDAPVRALALDGSGRLYAGGDFTASGDLALNRVAMWDGAKWSALGGGVSHNFGARVNALLWITGSNLLYVGGEFDTAGEQAADNIASWNGTSWSAVGSGTSPVVSLVEGPSIDSFKTVIAAGDTPPQQWDGDGWRFLGGWTFASPDGSAYPIDALAYDPRHNLLYAGGDFVLTNLSEPIQRLAVYNYSDDSWSQFGPPARGFEVRALLIDSLGGLYVAGNIVGAPDGIPYYNPANGGIWTSIPGGPFATLSNALALNPSGTELFVGGVFTADSDGQPLAYLARHRLATGQWSSLATLPGDAPNGTINDLIVAPNGDMYVAGRFSLAGPTAAKNIARWDGTDWHALGDGVGIEIYEIEMDIEGNIYAAGLGIDGVSKWNGSDWGDAGNGLSGIIRSLAFDNNGRLLAGGRPVSVGGTSTTVARLTGTTWSALGARFQLDPYTLLVSPSNKIYAGGFPTEFRGTQAVYEYNPGSETWSGIGATGQNSIVHALALDARRQLIAGGNFRQSSTPAYNDIAVWDGNNWIGYGDGPTSDVYDIIYVSRKLLLAATRNGTIERWNGTSWSTLFEFNDAVNRIVLDEEAAALTAGGRFATADGSPSSFLATYGSALTLPNGSWRLFVLPLNPASSWHTVQQVFGDDIPGSYPDDWVIYEFIEATQSYRALDGSDQLIPGRAYWVIQLSGDEQSIDLPKPDTTLAGTKSSACTTDKGCFEKQLIAASDKSLWGMLGSPFFSNSLFEQFRITADSGACSDSDGCTLDEAGPDNANILQSVLWAYDGTGYVSASAATGGGFEWWTGYWARVIAGANANNPTLLIPK